MLVCLNFCQFNESLHIMFTFPNGMNYPIFISMAKPSQLVLDRIVDVRIRRVFFRGGMPSSIFLTPVLRPLVYINELLIIELICIDMTFAWLLDYLWLKLFRSRVYFSVTSNVGLWLVLFYLFVRVHVLKLVFTIIYSLETVLLFFMLSWKLYNFHLFWWHLTSE